MTVLAQQLGISSGRDIDEALQLATEVEVAVVELACQHRGQRPADLPASRRRRIANEAQARQIQLVVHSDSAVNVAEIHPGIRRAVKEHLGEYLRLGADVDATRLVVHAGLHFDSSDRTAVLDAATDTLARTAAIAEKNGITLVLENMNVLNSEIDYFGVTAQDICDVLDAVDSPALRACADLGHAHLLPGGITEFVSALSHRIDYVQLTDNDGFVDHHLPLGSGTVDLAVVAASLGAVDFSGPIVAELDDRDARLTSVEAMRTSFCR